MRKLACIASTATLLVFGASSALAQSRTAWQMHDGLEVTAGNPLGLVPFTCNPTIHGDSCEYDDATIPPANDAGWGPAPDPDIIGFSLFPSRVCQAPNQCLAYGDFTYFQTFVNIPTNLVITTFTIDFNGMDDGCRVSIFNSAYPGGLVVPGSYVFLYGSGTTNLRDYVVSGEVNRVVVTQVDDCCVENNLRSAVVVLNGTPVVTNRSPDCSHAVACEPTLWPPNHKLRAVSICGVTDPDGDPVTITVTGVKQDEPVNEKGDGNTWPDAVIESGAAQVRAERSGSGNGRVYQISFTASDGQGGSCSGSVLVCVPHDQSQHQDPPNVAGSPEGRRPARLRDGETCTAVDDGQIYNSLGPSAPHDQVALEATTDVTLKAAPHGSDTATLEYSLPGAGNVTIALYDIASRRVATLFNGHQDAGVHQLSWNTASLETGMYFCRVQAGQRVISKSFLRLR